MSTKVFSVNTEDIYQNLNDTQKEIYSKDFTSMVKANLLTGILFGIIFIIFTVGIIITILMFDAPQFLWFIFFLTAIFSLISIFLIVKSAIELKQAPDLKIKNYILTIEKKSVSASKNLLNRPYTTNTLVEIRCVNFYVSQFFKNEDLKKICVNYINENVLDLTYLECMFIPFGAIKKENSNSAWDYKYNFIFPKKFNFEATPYIEILKQLDIDKLSADKTILFLSQIARGAGLNIPYNLVVKDISNKNEKDLTSAALEKLENIYAEVSKMVSAKFDNVKNLYNLLHNQNVIRGEKSNYQYFALIFILYYYQKLKFIEYSETILSHYNLTESPQKFNNKNNIAFDMNLVESLMLLGEDSETIIKVMVFLVAKYYQNISINKISLTVSSKINDYVKTANEKEKLDMLIQGSYKSQSKYNMAQIDLMDGKQFEIFVADLFLHLGYHTEVTKTSGDQGVDVIAKKGEKIIAIQAKHYNQAVGNHAIMEVVAGAKFYNATLCYVVTNNYFTKSAKELAATNNVILWDRDMLIEKIREI